MDNKIKQKEEKMDNSVKEFKVGQVWRNGCGDDVKITEVEDFGKYPVIGIRKRDGEMFRFMDTGDFLKGDHSVLSLVDLVPAPLPFRNKLEILALVCLKELGEIAKEELSRRLSQ